MLWLLLSSNLVGLVACAAPSETESVQPTNVDARVVPSQVVIGQPFEYVLVLKHPAQIRYELRRLNETGVFEILNTKRERKDETTSSTTTFRVELAVFDVGKHILPEWTFDVFHDGQASEWKAPAQEVECISTLTPNDDKESEALADIRPPEPFYIRSLRLLYALGSALALLAVGIVLFRWWKKRKPMRPVEMPPLSLKEKTLSQLKALSNKRLPEKLQIREFHYELSEITREWLGEKFVFDAMECTSFELMDIIEKKEFLPIHKEKMRAFLTQADLARYARTPISQEDCDNAIVFIRQLVSEMS